MSFLNHYKADDKKIYISLLIAFFLNLSCVFIEIVGAFWTNSTAILADALHDTGDCLAIALNIFLFQFINKPENHVFSFGYRRFTLLGTLISGCIILLSSLFVFYESIPRLLEPEAIYAPGMLFLALFGITANSIAALLLYKDLSKTNPVLTWHFIEDILGWGAILIASGVLYFVDFPILDPLLAILISSYIIWNVIKHLKPILMLFLQAVPHQLEIAKIEEKICAMKEVKSVHNTHIWGVDSQVSVLTTHILVQNIDSIEKIVALKKKIKLCIKKFSIDHVTIELEFDEEKCYMDSKSKIKIKKKN